MALPCHVAAYGCVTVVNVTPAAVTSRLLQLSFYAAGSRAALRKEQQPWRKQPQIIMRLLSNQRQRGMRQLPVLYRCGARPNIDPRYQAGRLDTIYCAGHTVRL